MKKIVIFLAVGLILVSNTTACGWFSYEDEKDTRIYYNIEDKLEGVEDGVLKVSRYPNDLEIEKNIYIPMTYNG